MVQIWPGQVGKWLEQERAFGLVQLCRLGGLTGGERISFSEPREKPDESSWYETEKGRNTIIGMVVKEGHLCFLIFEEFSYLFSIHIEEWQFHWLIRHFTIHVKGQARPSKKSFLLEPIYLLHKKASTDPNSVQIRAKALLL